jgi:hypothetical protein
MRNNQRYSEEGYAAKKKQGCQARVIAMLSSQQLGCILLE